MTNIPDLSMEKPCDQMKAFVFLAKVSLLQNTSEVANLHNSVDLSALPGVSRAGWDVD